jgi:YbbR domain-containing protein
VKRFFRFFTHNWDLKLLSAVLALVLWVYVVSAEAPQLERVLMVAVETENMGQDLSLAKTLPPVSIRIRASVRVEVGSENIHAYVDLEGKAAGQFLLPVLLSPIPGANLLEANPDQLLVQLENVETTTLPVEIIFLGRLPQGLSLGQDQIVEPGTVSFQGPHSVLIQAQRAVAAVDLTDLSNSVSQTVSVRILDREGKELPLIVTPETVKVSIPVNRESLIKTVPITPRIVSFPGSGFVIRSVTVEPSIATLEGTSESLDSILAISTMPISVDGSRESFTESVDLDIAQLQASLLTESVVQVTVELVEAAQAEFEVTVESLDASWPAVMDPPQITITVVGPKVEIESLRSSDFLAEVNLKGLMTREYSLPLKITVPMGITLLNTSTITIGVKPYP